MNNFDLHTPTRILFGKGAIEKLREQIGRASCRERV